MIPILKKRFNNLSFSRRFRRGEIPCFRNAEGASPDGGPGHSFDPEEPTMFHEI
jgi:hypothetical protein